MDGRLLTLGVGLRWTVVRVIGAGLTAGMATAAVHGQARPAPGPGPAAQRYVAIGCVTREGTAGAPRFVLTDPRGEQQTVYRIEGDRALLAPHAGHTMEVAGVVTPAPAGAASGRATLKVSSLVWISGDCRQANRK